MLTDRFDARYYGRPLVFRYRPHWFGGTFSRTSAATTIGRDGLVTPVASGIPRIAWLDLDGDGVHETPALRLEGSSTNGIRNPRGEGAVVGTIGSGGALPTFWARDALAGLTWEVVATGVEDGLPYVDVRLHGTPTQTFAQLRFDGTMAIAAAPGQTWTGSFYARRVGGSMAGIGEARVRIQERDAGGVSLNQSQSTFDPDSAPRLSSARRTHTHTVSDPNAAAVVLLFGVGGLTVGNAIDVTFRIGAPQLERSAVASSLILPPPGAPAAATRAADALSFPLPASLSRPVPMTLYLRFIERGAAFAQAFQADIMELGDSGTSPFLQIDNANSTGTYRALYRAAGGQDSISNAPVAVAIGDVVELAAVLTAAGAARIRLARNGGAEQAGPLGMARGLGTTPWSAQTLKLAVRNQSPLDVLECKVALGEYTIAELRAM